jgi:hypothetical protein
MFKPFTFAVAAAAVVLVSACARTNATLVSRNQVLISTSAAPACGRAGAARVASQMAAVETLRNGYSRFIIQQSGSASNVQVVQRPPTGAFTTGTFNTFGGTTHGTAQTTFTGGGPMIFGAHDADLMVLMLNPGDPNYANGVDARQVLGSNWEELVAKGIRTCN